MSSSSNGSDPSNGAGTTTPAQRRAALVAARLAPWVLELYGTEDGQPSPLAFALDGPEHSSVALQHLRALAADEQLQKLLRTRSKNAKQHRAAVERRVRELIEGQQVDVCSADLFWATWAGEWPVELDGLRPGGFLSKARLRSTAGKVGGWLRRKWAAAWLGIVIGGVVALTVWPPGWSDDLTRLELFAVAVLAFFPGWLFVRFVGFRAGAVWDEYVLNLHRLGADRPEHLPRPPTNSLYYERWVAAGGAMLTRQPTIYQQKFEAYYGRRVSSSRHGEVKTEALFPVYLTTAVIAVGWTAIFAGLELFGPAPAPAEYSTVEMMAFGFTGAYAFLAQMLVRRFFQADLKPSAYAAALVRITVAVGVVAILHRAELLSGEPGMAVAAAFVVGSFPLVGLQALQRGAATVLKGLVPVLEFPHPLSDIEGLSIWYEARLLEEGIEDMQNLLTANLPEVILHTRVPVGRLVDWLDQAHLALRLPALSEEDRQDPNASPNPRCALRNIGVRSASGFLDAFPLEKKGWRLTPAGLSAAKAVESVMSVEEITTLARVLDAEPGLETVWHWRCWRSCLVGKDSKIGEGRQHTHRHEIRESPNLVVGAVLDGVGHQNPARAEAKGS